MKNNLKKIKKLREETSISLSDCKKALEEASGDYERAKELLKIWGKDVSSKRAGRETNQGIVSSYIHSNRRVGVILELNCESDFVAKNEDFKKLANELCLQVVATNSLFVKEEDIDQELLDAEKRVFLEQLVDMGKPQEIADKIVIGKLEKYKKEICLMSQPWIKDNTKTINDLINESISKLGENIVIKRFTKYEI
jgi:elongation factor Ts